MSRTQNQKVFNCNDTCDRLLYICYHIGIISIIFLFIYYLFENTINTYFYFILYFINVSMSFQYKSKMCSESVLLKYSLKYQLFLQKLHLIS